MNSLPPSILEEFQAQRRGTGLFFTGGHTTTGFVGKGKKYIALVNLEVLC